MTPKLPCPHCGEYMSAVIDTRAAADGQRVLRTRRCLFCKNTYTTQETLSSRKVQHLERRVAERRAH